MPVNTIESALEILLAHTESKGEIERVGLMESLGRVLAEDICSSMNVPPFQRSPLDGYALHSEDLKGASREHPVILHVIGEADAGCGTHFTVKRGEALRIMTGAPVPESCDCVIRQEETDEGMAAAQFYGEVASGMNICPEGEDIARGSLMIRRGTLLSSAEIGVMASIGVTEVSVFPRVRVALLCSGDEIRQPGEILSFGQIYDSSRSSLCARLVELGCEVVQAGDCPDDPAEAAKRLCEAAQTADILITTGGVSVGKKDIFHQVLPLMGAERLFWKVAMKPGSPMLCGLYDGKLIICLSGNPFSARAGFELFAKPVLRKLGGMNKIEDDRTEAVLDGEFKKGSPQRRMVRGRVLGGVVRLTEGSQGNGTLSGMMGCNCLIDLPAGSPAMPVGSRVKVILL